MLFYGNGSFAFTTDIFEGKVTKQHSTLWQAVDFYASACASKFMSHYISGYVEKLQSNVTDRCNISAVRTARQTDTITDRQRTHTRKHYAPGGGGIKPETMTKCDIGLVAIL